MRTSWKRALARIGLLLCVVTPGMGCAETEPADLETYFCHAEFGLCSEIVIAQIESAHATLECAVYTFTLEKIAEALADASARGVRVWVVVESDQEDIDVSGILQRDGVFVRKDGNGDLMHHKFMVVDGHRVVTGSYNWTYSADNKHDENLQVIHSSAVSDLYQAEFKRIWAEGK